MATEDTGCGCGNRRSEHSGVRTTHESLTQTALRATRATPPDSRRPDARCRRARRGRGRYAGTARITDTAPGASVTDSAIQQMLEREVARKSIPAGTANTLYFAFLPPGVTVVAGSERSCQAFCGYHERSAGGLFYAVVPYPNCAGCLADLQPLDALTSVCSHELAEAITDPVPGQGWYDDSNGEIGDVCAWQNKKLGAYDVQLVWSNRANACV